MQSFNQAYRMAKNVLPSVVVFLNDRLTIVTTSPSWIRWFVNGKKASLESHEINTAILNWYPSHTEIFSKRRKICALWAKDLSMIFRVPSPRNTLATTAKRLWARPKVGLIFKGSAGNGPCFEKWLGTQNVWSNFCWASQSCSFHEQPLASPSWRWSQQCCHLSLAKMTTCKKLNCSKGWVDREKAKKKCQQHPVFPSGHPSKYWLGSTLLNFSDRTRTGVFSVIWPLAKVGAKHGLFESQDKLSDTISSSSSSFPWLSSSWGEIVQLFEGLSWCFKIFFGD